MGAPRMFGYLESFRAEPTSLHTLLRLWLLLQAGEVDGRRDNLDDCLVQDSKVASEALCYLCVGCTECPPGLVFFV